MACIYFLTTFFAQGTLPAFQIHLDLYGDQIDSGIAILVGISDWGIQTVPSH